MEPTGVEYSTASTMPMEVLSTEMAAAQITTPRKLLNTRMAESAGKITSAEISREPTRFMASTMITAVITAMSILWSFAFMPVAEAKTSSKVTAKMRL